MLKVTGGRSEAGGSRVNLLDARIQRPNVLSQVPSLDIQHCIGGAHLVAQAPDVQRWTGTSDVLNLLNRRDKQFLPPFVCESGQWVNSPLANRVLGRR